MKSVKTFDLIRSYIQKSTLNLTETLKNNLYDLKHIKHKFACHFPHFPATQKSNSFQTYTLVILCLFFSFYFNNIYCLGSCAGIILYSVEMARSRTRAFLGYWLATPSVAPFTERRTRNVVRKSRSALKRASTQWSALVKL